jgi:2'-phosphotransferase
MDDPRTPRRDDDDNRRPAKNEQRSKRKPLSPAVQLSKKMSWVLRHKCFEMGLTMTPDGYVAVHELLALELFRDVSVEEIRTVVANNDKQRFKLEQRQEDLFIRANQGHSIAVDANRLLTRLTPEALSALPIVIHGTSTQAWESIQTQGLSRMGRTHIHFATGLPKDEGVISGMRRQCPVHIYIDTNKCAEDGILFYRSENNVILTAGVEEKGTLPTAYFAKVTDRAGNVITMI